jgi:hypothetical protein
MSKIPGDNGSSVNKLITLKINVLANITLIETSVSVVYLSVYYSIYYSPLLYAHLGTFRKVYLPPMYNPIIESSYNDQIQLELFVSIDSTDIYISSSKFVLTAFML